MVKLSALNLDCKLPIWIEFFCTDCFQKVTVNGVYSNPTPVTSGVPQGAVLGPLLFLIYCNDLPCSVSSYIHIYAYDCVVYRDLQRTGRTSIQQRDLDSLTGWCENWIMELNTNKCKRMRVFRKHECPPVYKLTNTSLEHVSCNRYLVLTLQRLIVTWKTRINVIIISDNQVLGYLRYIFSRAPTALKLLLFKTLVRSKLEYTTAIWDLNHDKLVNALELLQNNAPRFIVQDYCRTDSRTLKIDRTSLSHLAL